MPDPGRNPIAQRLDDVLTRGRHAPDHAPAAAVPSWNLAHEAMEEIDRLQRERDRLYEEVRQAQGLLHDALGKKDRLLEAAETVIEDGFETYSHADAVEGAAFDPGVLRAAIAACKGKANDEE